MSLDAHDIAQAAEDAVRAQHASARNDGTAMAIKALTRAILACPDADALEALINRPFIQGWFPLASEELSPVADALVDLAEALAHAGDAARVLGWTLWACTPSPIELVYPGFVASPYRIEACLPAFETRAPLYRRWLGDASPERRVAGAHALAWCRSATPADAALVLVGAAGERDARALGSALVTLGVLVRRLGAAADADAARPLALKMIHHADVFVRASAAAALALMKETLSAEATSALTEVVAHPGPLPAGWGWRTAGRTAHQSNSFGCAVLNWAPTSAAEEAARVLALVELPHNPGAEAKLAALRKHVGEEAYRDALLAKWEHAGPCEGLIMGALAHLGFEARGYSPPLYGLVASDLDAMQRLTLEAMGRRTPQAPWILERVGLNASAGDPDIVTDFLEGTKLEWRPISITVDGRVHHWHFGALWCATVLGAVSVSAATDAILAVTTPADAVDLVTRFESARKPAYDRIDDKVGWERDQELALAVIDAAVARGFDLDDMMRTVAANTHTGLPAIAAVAYLRAHPDYVPPEHWSIIEEGLEQTRVPEPLQSLVAAWRARTNRG